MATKEKREEVLNEEEVKKAKVEDSAELEKEKTDKKKAEDEKKEKKKTSKKKKSGAAAELDKKEKELEDLRYKMSEMNDKYIRLSAEFDNYRKRTLKEKSELIKTAGGDVLSDILPVADDFERALQSMETAADIDAVKDGIGLIFNKFKEFLSNKGIVEIEAVNQEFDTDLHEAITKIPAPEEDLKGKVVDVIQKGYKIDEKVIRFAKVVVGE